MSIDLAASVLAGLIFFACAYAGYIRFKTGKWPKLRNPFAP